MAEVVARLKEDYRKVQPFILGSLEMANEGEILTDFATHGDQIGPYDCFVGKPVTLT